MNIEFYNKETGEEMNKKKLTDADCRCGGKEDGTARYAIGYIYCDSCGRRKKKRVSLWCK